MLASTRKMRICAAAARAAPERRWSGCAQRRRGGPAERGGRQPEEPGRRTTRTQRRRPRAKGDGGRNGGALPRGDGGGGPKRGAAAPSGGGGGPRSGEQHGRRAQAEAAAPTRRLRTRPSGGRGPERRPLAAGRPGGPQSGATARRRWQRAAAVGKLTASGGKHVIVSIVGLLLFGRLLEPLWGAKELLKFIFIVNLSTSVCVFVTAIVLYYITQQEIYLYTPLSGFYGVLSGFLVGIKQILPDQELNLFVLKIKAKWIPSLVALISVAVSFFLKESMSYLPTILFGIYMSWVYLRYFQKRLEAGLKGDPSDEFSFSSFFPEFLRPILDPIASIFHKLVCGRSERSEGKDQTFDGLLPGSDSIEANRRRERGQRALEQRLAEKLAAVGSSEGTLQQQENAYDKV